MRICSIAISCSASAIAGRIGTRVASTSIPAGRTFVHIDIDPTQIGRVFSPELGIVADAGLALEALVAEARERKPPRRTARRATRGSRRRANANGRCCVEPISTTCRSNRSASLQEVNAAFDDDTQFVTAIGLYQILSGQLQRVHKPRNYIVCGQAGPLGWEVSACTGAKLANPAEERRRHRRRLLVTVSHRRAGGRGAVPHPVRHDLAQQRLPRTHPAGVASIRDGLRSRRSTSATSTRRTSATTASITSRRPKRWGAARSASSIRAKSRRRSPGPSANRTTSRVPVIVEVITERITNIAMGAEIDSDRRIRRRRRRSERAEREPQLV